MKGRRTAFGGNFFLCETFSVLNCTAFFTAFLAITLAGRTFGGSTLVGGIFTVVLFFSFFTEKMRRCGIIFTRELLESLITLDGIVDVDVDDVTVAETTF